MRAPLIWAGGLIGSLVAHGAAFAFLNLSVEPDPTPTQPKPETQLSMEAYQVDRLDAPEQQAESEAAPEAEGETTDLSQGAIPLSRSEAQSPASQALQDAAAPTANLSASAPAAEVISGSNPAANQLTESTPAPSVLAEASAPQAIIASSQALSTNRIAATSSPAQTIASISTATEAVQQVVMRQDATTAAEPSGESVASLAAPTEAATQATATGMQTAPATPDAPQADQPPLPAQFAKASLAWNFGDRVVTDPAAIATIQAFMAPQALDGSEEVRDGLSSLLTSIDCARLSATFIPETGALELRGHVPDNALRAPVLKALQDQIGEGITVTDNLLHLPKPQCGALSGIADVGLPQSTDQLTNKRLIGDNAQAVEYTYSEGQPLTFDLTAPDYDAVVYVDYFDADGQVIHLVPNEIVPLKAYRAKEVVGIERGDGPKLNITIGPPFGQEIAVAFAASRPLFDEVRPIIEPAAPYLEFLKAKVAEARAADPDFKGEWVYFFITTQPAT